MYVVGSVKNGSSDSSPISEELPPELTADMNCTTKEDTDVSNITAGWTGGCWLLCCIDVLLSSWFDFRFSILHVSIYFWVLTDLESPGINLVRESPGILLMVMRKIWRVSSELRDCCLFLLKKNNENTHSVQVITKW